MRRGTEHFPRSVDSLDELPYEASSAIRAQQPAESVRQIIVIPPQEYPLRRAHWLRELPFGWRKTPLRTLAFGDEQITLVEKDSGGRLRSEAIPLAALVELHLTTILLYATLELAWAREDQLAECCIEFNLVGRSLIRQGIDFARRQIAAPPDAAAAPAEVSLDALPLKFRNFLRDCLLPGEALRTVVYQPALHRAAGWLHPALSPNRAIAITDQHLLLVEEALRSLRQEYAMITRFYPLRSVQAAAVEPGSESPVLTLQLGIGRASHRLSLPLDPSNAEILRGTLTPPRSAKKGRPARRPVDAN